MRWNTIEYSGWGRAVSATGPVARPERAAHVAEIMAAKPAPAIGNRRSYGDACLNDGGAAIDLSRLDRMLSFDPEHGVLTVEGGCALGEIARHFAPKGWLPAVMPGTGFATVGGAIANDVHGKNHHHAGSFGHHVRRIVLETPIGRREVTEASDPALFRATIGGLGQTGAIVEADIALVACKGDVMIVTERRAPDFDAFLALLDASEATYTVGWIDATATGANLGRGILEEGETGGGLVPAPAKARAVPFDAPGFALSSPVVRLFNQAYYRRVPAAGRTVVKPIQDFFFPLDKIRDWNRLYGKSGFHQFQCVVPVAASEALRDMLRRIASSAMASPLAVLKRMGNGQAGPLSFPMEGYTLAVDFTNSARATGLIETLEEMTRAAEGRIYLAKDALASGEAIRAMYPEWQSWRDTVATVDPEHQLETDLIRRLGLRGAS